MGHGPQGIRVANEGERAMTGQTAWDQHWADYADSASPNPAQAYRRRLILGALRQTVSEGSRILDVGSGQGDLARDLRQSFPQAEVLGLELSKTGVEIAQKKVPSAQFLQRDLAVYEAPPAEYREWATHGVCSEVLEHVAEPVPFLRNVAPHMRLGGTLVVTVPGGPMSAFDRHIGHLHHFTPDTLRQTLTDGGFRARQVSGAGFPFFNLYRLVVIMRGRKLIDDVAATGGRAPSSTALFAMGVFDRLFALNTERSAFGWQLVAVAERA
jgi:SAM-dependent methyltransferase